MGNITGVPQQTQGIKNKLTMQNIPRESSDSLLPVQQFRRRMGSNIHRLRQPRNFQIKIDVEQEIKNFNKNLTELNNNINEEIQLNELKKQEKSQLKHKRRHE